MAAAEIHQEEVVVVKHHLAVLKELQEQQLVVAVVVLLVDSIDNTQHNSDIHHRQRMDLDLHSIEHSNRLYLRLLAPQALQL